jgi:hypothetical protein
MLEFLRGRATDRKLRLFGVACWRRASYLIELEHQQRAVEVAERYGDGLASLPQLAAVRGAALGVAAGTGWTAATEAVRTVSRHTHRAGDRSAAGPDVWRVSMASGSLALVRDSPPARGRRRVAASEAVLRAVLTQQRREQTALLRDILGPRPFRPVTVNPDVLAWNDRLVPRLAQAIYEERRWGDMPILGDALLDAGCDNDEVVAHCRSGGEHLRGCWVVDLLLGKE